MATATKELFDKLNQLNNTVVFVYGGVCSAVTKPIAESMFYFNMWQVANSMFYMLTCAFTHALEATVLR